MGIRNKIYKFMYNSKILNCGNNVYIEPPISIDFKFLDINDDSSILKYSRILNVSGDETVKIKIGNSTGIGYHFTALAGANITIGDNVAIASDVALLAGNHGTDPECGISYGNQRVSGKPICINDNVWIGEKVIVLSGVSIGKEAIIGAGAIVNKDIPPYSIAIGNPARVIKKYDFNNHEWMSIDK